ncbi:MAG: YhgE/Pip domain-containing protein [Ligilactobacillus sp.]|nr:YhgE/Pip domain-containing protein [Ligilactobacillus sp.]
MRAIRKEFSVIKNHKLLLATVTAIMIIPFLYSFFFLKSVWDPYASTGSLPVAVVNQDQAVTYRGKEFAVGQQLVKKLKKNDQMGWHFVTKEKADYGLSHKKYYMVITIPKNFSKNATTVLNTHPKKMDLTYTTNDSLNYIGAVMSEAAAKQLNTQIRQTVSTAYADTMFDAVKGMKKGFKTAASGSAKLADGSKVLTDGINTYTAGVSQVNDGVMTLQAGVLPLASGVNALATGANTLASGIGTYTNGVNQVNAGVGQLAQKTPALAAGVGQLANGSQSLTSGLNTYTSGVNQVNEGVGTLRSGIGNYTNGVKQVNAGLAKLDDNSAQLNTGSQELVAGLSQVNSGVQSFSGLAANLPKLKQGLTAAASQVSALKAGLQTSQNLQGSLAQLKAQANNASQLNGDAQSKIQAVMGNSSLSDADKQNLQAALGDVQKSQGITSALANMSAPTSTDASGISGKLDALSQQLTAAANQLDSVNPAQLQNLQAGIAKLLAGATTLQNGVKSYTDGVAMAYAGTGALTQNNSKLTSGADALAQGTSQLAANSGALTSGASQLSNGLWVLNGQIPTLTAGVNQLANGTGQLAANSGALNAGAGQLASGLGTLNSKVPTLSSGIGQLANGTNQLVANSPALTAGAGKIGAGNLQLSTALAGGVKKIDQINMNDENASMFAAPSNLKHKNYSYVPNYGHALAPYMLSVALYVGALVFNLVYPLKRIDFEDETPGEWFLAKTSIGALVATGNAVVEIGLMYLAGLKPDYFWATFFNAWLFSLAMMYLIMFLSVALDNPGRFLGMIILVLQLGGAGGSFPIQVTKGLNGFFQAINPYLPMTYSIYGFRESLTGGLGANQMLISYSVQIFVIILCLVLTYLAMMVMRPKVGYVRGVEKTE